MERDSRLHTTSVLACQTFSIRGIGSTAETLILSLTPTNLSLRAGFGDF